jgi:hypothetical protein
MTKRSRAFLTCWLPRISAKALLSISKSLIDTRTIFTSLEAIDIKELSIYFGGHLQDPVDQFGRIETQHGYLWMAKRLTPVDREGSIVACLCRYHSHRSGQQDGPDCAQRNLVFPRFHREGAHHFQSPSGASHPIYFPYRQFNCVIITLKIIARLGIWPVVQIYGHIDV